MPTPLLDLEEVSKTFPGNAALKAVSFSVPAGEVHALMGENGAGKSTLVKIIAGEHARTSGKIRIKGEEILGRLDAVQQGLGLVHQELSLVPALSITENIYLGGFPDASDQSVGGAPGSGRASRCHVSESRLIQELQ